MGLGNCGGSEARKRAQADKIINKTNEKHLQQLQSLVRNLFDSEHDYRFALEAKLLRQFEERQNENLEEKLASKSPTMAPPPETATTSPLVASMEAFNDAAEAEIFSFYAMDDEEGYPEEKEPPLTREEVEEAMYGPVWGDPAWASQPGRVERLRQETIEMPEDRFERVKPQLKKAHPTYQRSLLLGEGYREDGSSWGAEGSLWGTDFSSYPSKLTGDPDWEDATFTNLHAQYRRKSTFYRSLEPGSVPLFFLFLTMLVFMVGGGFFSVPLSLVATCFATWIAMELGPRFRQAWYRRVPMTPEEVKRLTRERGGWSSRKTLVADAHEIRVIEERPHLLVALGDRKQRMALLDTGATSCCIHPLILEELEKANVPLRVESRKMTLEGVIKGAKSSLNKVVYLDLFLEEGVKVEEVPFLVIDNRYGILLGSNLVRSGQWSSCWKYGRYFLQIGSSLVPTYFKRPPSVGGELWKRNEASIAATTATSVYDTVVLPHKKMVVTVKLQNRNDLDWNKKDLLVTSLEEGQESSFEVVPCRTIEKGPSLLQIEVKNNEDHPIVIQQGEEIAKVDTVGEGEVFTLHPFQNDRVLFENIPRIMKMGCHCKPTPCREEEMLVYIEMTNHFGGTSTGEYLGVDWNAISTGVSPGSTGASPGFSLVKHYEESPPLDSKALTLLVTPDKRGSFQFLSTNDFVSAQAAVQQLGEKHEKKPLFYFLDPLVEIDLNTRTLMANIFRYFPFTFMPVRLFPKHTLCIRPAYQGWHPGLITGIEETRIHVQLGHGLPPEGFLERDSHLPVFQVPLGAARIQLYRQGASLMCYLHLPLLRNSDEYEAENHRRHLIRAFLIELRFFRIPNNVTVTLDGLCPQTRERLSFPYCVEEFDGILDYVPPMFPADVRCSWPCRQSEEPFVKVDPYIDDCYCALCAEEEENTPPSTITLFKGDLRERLKQQDHGTNGSLLFATTTVKEETHLRSEKDFFPKTFRKLPLPNKASIYEFLGLEEEDDMNMPLDMMNLVDEGEMQKYINEIPETENLDKYAEEERNPEGLPPVIKTDPSLYQGYSLEGIPDQFRPGDWRKTDMMDRLQDVKEETKKAFGDLLDKHQNCISYYPTDGRPLIFDGKPVEVDIKLITDRPVFLKPYPITGRMVQVLDAKLDELLSRNEIIPIESKYNMPILLTHHNSENKHVDFKDRKWRLVVDNRVINSLMEDKNLYSFLVRGVEQLFTKLQGAQFLTTLDCVRAYRSLTASEFTRMATAFRTPSSIKYPHVTWTFRSTSDGLANLPGVYSLCIQQALSPHAKACTAAHIDDLICFSPSEEQHLIDLDVVFTDLGSRNFLVSGSKLQPFRREVQVLGHIVDGKHLRIPEARKAYFNSLQEPTTKKSLQSFLGVCNYMSSFIESYAVLVAILYDLLKGKTEKGTFRMNELQRKAFLQIKEAIVKAEKLHLLDTSRTIYMECDASMCGVGSIIYHETKDEQGNLKRDIVRYGSRRHSLTEALHHTSLEREAMAILISAKQHMYFLASCPESVIKTDLKSLITILSCYNAPESARMARLSHRLYSLPFKWSLVHIPGTQLPVADALSRLYPPYQMAFSDRHLRYPDLKRENIYIPPHWENRILTTTDILEAMYDQIVFIEKSSNTVKEKRLKALLAEITVLYDMLKKENGEIDSLKTMAEDKIQQLKSITKPHIVKLAPLTSVADKVIITPEYISKKQNENAKLSNILLLLRTLPKERIPREILDKYRVLNDAILVTRKFKNQPFDAPGNLRIVCDKPMTLYIMAVLHVMSSHPGQNTLNLLFTNTYKCVEGSAQSYVKIICTGCRACRFYRPSHTKTVPEGRIPLPEQPCDTWMIDFMVFEQNQTYFGKKVAASFNILDLYSNLLISYLCPNQTHQTVILCLRQLFSHMKPPRKIVSDNAKQLCRNTEVINFLKKNGIEVIATTTPYHSRANKVERAHKLLREVLQLMKETFRRSTQFDLYYDAVKMINSRPLALALHPHIKEQLQPGESRVVTPFSLHTGIPAPRHPTIELENDVLPHQRDIFRKRWQQIIKVYDKTLQEELKLKNQDFKGTGLQIGDLVLVKDPISTKEQLRYYKGAYEIIRIHEALYYCAPLFTKGRILEVNGNSLKPYNYSELHELLPDDIKLLMGEGLSPQELKAKGENKEETPADFTDWRVWRPPQKMALRNRLAPQSEGSIPAIQIRGSEMSTDYDTTSSLFTIPETIPDCISEATTFLDPARLKLGVPFLKTTKQGLRELPKVLPFSEIKKSSISLQASSRKEEKERLLKQHIKQKKKEDKRQPQQSEDSQVSLNKALKPPHQHPVDSEKPKSASRRKKTYSDDSITPYPPTKIIVEETVKRVPIKTILKKPKLVPTKLDFSASGLDSEKENPSPGSRPSSPAPDQGRVPAKAVVPPSPLELDRGTKSNTPPAKEGRSPEIKPNVVSTPVVVPPTPVVRSPEHRSPPAVQVQRIPEVNPQSRNISNQLGEVNAPPLPRVGEIQNPAALGGTDDNVPIALRRGKRVTRPPDRYVPQDFRR